MECLDPIEATERIIDILSNIKGVKPEEIDRLPELLVPKTRIVLYDYVIDVGYDKICIGKRRRSAWEVYKGRVF